jgi:hypothetical protein
VRGERNRDPMRAGHHLRQLVHHPRVRRARLLALDQQRAHRQRRDARSVELGKRIVRAGQHAHGKGVPKGPLDALRRPPVEGRPAPHPIDEQLHRAPLVAELERTGRGFPAIQSTCRYAWCRATGSASSTLHRAAAAWRPLDIAARHLVRGGQLREVLRDWVGEPQAITAVLPPHGRAAPAKVRLYLDDVAAILGSDRRPGDV